MTLNPTLRAKFDQLQAIIDSLESAVVAFSGGIDSTLVLQLAHDRLGPQTVAVTAVSPTLPEEELKDCRRLADEIGTRLLLHRTDQLAIPDFARNDASRCYHCKTDLYSALDRIRLELGFRTTVNGVQADDLQDDRPGLISAKEWAVRSPLAEVGLGKEEVRRLARSLGLSNWDKPAAACLSSRIPRGIPIDRMTLSLVEGAEKILRNAGFRQVRVRSDGRKATLEVGRDEVSRLVEYARHIPIAEEIRTLGFDSVEIDPEGYRPGKANRVSVL
ncbi:MAG: ATP-dependent sacrificial sulfur transferase LarE [Nitrospiraceae bacterium]